MAAISFFGYFILGTGPGLVFFCYFIATKSFLVLLALFSCFLWLIVLLTTSAIFRGFEPIEATVVSYAGLLLGAVAIQELTRYGVWRIHKASMKALQSMAASSHHRFALIDQLYLAMAWGYGHGACQVIFFFVSILPLTTNDTTYYSDLCPRMSIFLMGALYSLAFGMLLCSIMVTSIDGYHTGNIMHIVWAPVMHFGAALATLANFKRNGCMIVMPVLLAVGLLNVIYAGQVVWRKGLTVARSPGGGVPLLPANFAISDALGAGASPGGSGTSLEEQQQQQQQAQAAPGQGARRQ